MMRPDMRTFLDIVNEAIQIDYSGYGYFITAEGVPLVVLPGTSHAQCAAKYGFTSGGDAVKAGWIRVVHQPEDWIIVDLDSRAVNQAAANTLVEMIRQGKYRNLDKGPLTILDSSTGHNYEPTTARAMITTVKEIMKQRKVTAESTDMRTLMQIVTETFGESAQTESVTIPITPVTGKPIGTVFLVISGDDFDELRLPFVATMQGWRQLDLLEKLKGRDDATLKVGGETIDDAALAADPRRKGLIAKPSWPTISHLYQLEALPPGSIILRPELTTDTDPEQRQQIKQLDGTWSCWSAEKGRRLDFDVNFLDGHLGRYELMYISAG